MLQRSLDIIDEIGIEPPDVWLGVNLDWFPRNPSVYTYHSKNLDKFRWTLFDQVFNLALFLVFRMDKFSSILLAVFDQGQPDVDNLQYFLDRKISHRNIGYGRVFPTKFMHSFLKNNITSNVWVVNSKWMFSLFWCTG